MAARVREFNLAQRIVVVVALGVMLRVAAEFIVAEWVSTESGWFGYMPLSAQMPSLGARPFIAALVWIVCTAVWAAASVWLLGQPYDGPARPDRAEPPPD